MSLLYLSVFRSQEGSTCVHIAAMKGSVAVIKELLKCNPSGITTARNKVILMKTNCIYLKNYVWNLITGSG